MLLAARQCAAINDLTSRHGQNQPAPHAGDQRSYLTLNYVSPRADSLKNMQYQGKTICYERLNPPYNLAS
jgi:hypothetical protein